MKNIIIGLASNYSKEDLMPWVLSAKQAAPNADVALILYNCSSETIAWLKSENIRIFSPMPENEHGFQYAGIPGVLPHNERLSHLWYFLKDVKEKYDLLITTDTRDVVFQKNPFPVLQDLLSKNPNKDFVASSESILYKDEVYWGADNFKGTFGDLVFEVVKDTPILNVGVIGGKAQYLIDFFLLLFFSSFAGFGRVVSDQSAFNLLLALSPLQQDYVVQGLESTWAAQMGVGYADKFDKARLERKPIWTGKSVLNANGEEYAIVHQYDRFEDMTKYFKDKYSTKRNRK